MTAAAILLDGPAVLVSVATSVLAPMALRIAGTGRRLPRLALGAGVLAACSLWLPAGGAAVALVAPYAAVCAIAGAIRLPMSETIEVWTADDPAAPPELRAWAAGCSTIARHDLWLFGIHYLSLDYGIRAARGG